MEPETITTKRHVILKFALVYAFLQIAIGLIMFILDLQAQGGVLISVVTLIAVVISLVMALKSRRDDTLGGFMTYGQGVGTGLLVALVASVVLIVWQFIFTNYIDPDMMDRMMDVAKKKMIEEGRSEEVIEQSIGMMAKMKSPLWMTVMGLLGNLFYGLIVSLIVSIFMKKADPNGGYNSLDA